MADSYERESINNQKRIIRELDKIANALEAIAGTNRRISLSDYITPSGQLMGNDKSNDTNNTKEE